MKHPSDLLRYRFISHLPSREGTFFEFEVETETEVEIENIVVPVSNHPVSKKKSVRNKKRI
ncbi:hypothetical protein GCM10008088_20410 [Mesonia mobilis]|uniref:Uncharacterized protein n=1 Tax=Mesonia mobilis TaxID=369791 RepID=A0ABQ3BVP5_9FLAO|nr:hypothetical protein GCM10008088_20410 [Mesonia mobilis]